MLSKCKMLKFSSFIFFFNDTATTEIYTLSLHDALPICSHDAMACEFILRFQKTRGGKEHAVAVEDRKSTRLKLQSRRDLVCRLLLEKKKRVICQGIMAVAYATRSNTDERARVQPWQCLN